MPQIVLATLNARYIHSSMGLRCLLANLGSLASETCLLEFVIQERAQDVVEKILAQAPAIVGLSVYVWNAREMLEVATLLKAVAPHITLVLGGPEVSHETEAQPIVEVADFVICGAADLAFAELCTNILRGDLPAQKVLKPDVPALDAICMPYRHYNDTDVAHRIIYVEASRGCPFKCEFCLSALDDTARPFDTDVFLREMDLLFERGVRHFKFVDRTFNLRIDTSTRILDFFLERLCTDLFLHFEVIPDHLPEQLRDKLALFPPGVLQLEVGIQSFNPEVQKRISRRQHNGRSKTNLRWLRKHTHAHLHADLIAGLPGETIESLADSFDQLVALDPHEIQMGILKRLRGSVVTRHTDKYKMVYSPFPPYNLLTNGVLDYATMQRITRFARYWDMVGNSGRFKHTLATLLADAPFARFMQLSDWLYRTTEQTHKINLKRLFRLLYLGMQEALQIDASEASSLLQQDYQRSELSGSFLPQEHESQGESKSHRPQRQQQHLNKTAP